MENLAIAVATVMSADVRKPIIYGQGYGRNEIQAPDSLYI